MDRDKSERHYLMGIRMNLTLKVVGNEFLTDPCSVDHHPECTPLRTAKNLVRRAVYEFYRDVGEDPTFANKKSKPLWHARANMIKQRAAEEPGIYKEVVAQHYRKGPSSRRDAIRRAVRVHDSPEAPATIEMIPERLRVLPDGSLFVHRLEPTLHVYYKTSTIQMAAQLGLHTLVADGVHSFQPRQLKRKGKLYTVHGVCSNGVEVPLLYAISSKKTEQVYTTIFGHMRDELGAAVPTRLRIVLDYEKAAINAVKRVFPHATVQGCAFHLALAWNRRRDKLGLRRFIKGVEGVPKSLEVERWWDTIKGLVFLPRRLHREVGALVAPPVPREHAAFTSCEDFLKYLRETWYTGMYSGLWDKFGVEELRTTNLAESYHRYSQQQQSTTKTIRENSQMLIFSQLNTLFEGDHPTLDQLILVLRDLEGEAQSALITLELDPSHSKHLRRKDRERRERIAHEMSSFDNNYHAGVSRLAVEDYCRNMARNVVENTV
ncbi:hypothetical protein ANCCAN_16358 [Ancylostoma caninum]|uniref:MULE transposase domain-containing protein n=1 Tax=Ancylostoma caninum TaxID=29170 RepID=A0A368G378_ANCCA|nr:hypothetical protein ANCCAN_16358 [Ancylostoma caninum]